MNKLVAKNQLSFVQVRQSTDNMIMVHELIHRMKRKKGKRGRLAVKINLEKAYDRISDV